MLPIRLISCYTLDSDFRLGINMVKVLPFRGLRYSVNAVTEDLSGVICPPYDVISLDEQYKLRGSLSSYNSINLELPEGDTEKRYDDAKSRLISWQTQGILKRDSTPKYYLLSHQFKFDQKSIERWGLTAAVRLEDYREGLVLPHEETGLAAKEDRFSLMKACEANLSPIMSLFRDEESKFKELRNTYTRKKYSDYFFDMGEGPSYETFAMWAVEGKEIEGIVDQLFDGKPLFIADGHHRYETAMRYKEWLQSQSEYWAEDSAANFVMMTLIEFDDPGLMILPYHRTLGHISTDSYIKLKEGLLEVFEVIPSSTPITSGRELESMVQASEGVVIGIHDAMDSAYLLRLRDDFSLDELSELPERDTLGKHGAWVLQQILEQQIGDQVEKLEYSHDPEEVWDSVVDGHKVMGFYLNAFPLDLFESIVSMGSKLPRKSTYFHPKLPTGMVFNLLSGKL